MYSLFFLRVSCLKIVAHFPDNSFLQSWQTLACLTLPMFEAEIEKSYVVGRDRLRVLFADQSAEICSLSSGSPLPSDSLRKRTCRARKCPGRDSLNVLSPASGGGGLECDMELDPGEEGGEGSAPSFVQFQGDVPGSWVQGGG